MARQSLVSVSQAWGSASGWDGAAWYIVKSLSSSGALRREGMVAGPDEVCSPFALELSKTTHHHWVCARPRALSQKRERPAGVTAAPRGSRKESTAGWRTKRIQAVHAREGHPDAGSTRTNLEDTVLRETSQSQKDKSCMMPLVCGP